MGNSIYHRILSNDPELLFTVWQVGLDSKFGSSIFLGEEANQISEKLTQYTNQDIKALLLDSKQEEQAFHRSRTETIKSELRSLLPGDYMKYYGFEQDQLVIRYPSVNKSYQAIQHYRLELCLIVHLWQDNYSQRSRKVHGREKEIDVLKEIFEVMKTAVREENEKWDSISEVMSGQKKLQSRLLETTISFFYDDLMNCLTSPDSTTTNTTADINDDEDINKLIGLIAKLESVISCISDPAELKSQESVTLVFREKLELTLVRLIAYISEICPILETRNQDTTISSEQGDGITLELLKTLLSTTIHLSSKLDSLRFHLLVIDLANKHSSLLNSFELSKPLLNLNNSESSTNKVYYPLQKGGMYLDIVCQNLEIQTKVDKVLEAMIKSQQIMMVSHRDSEFSYLYSPTHIIVLENNFTQNSSIKFVKLIKGDFDTAALYPKKESDPNSRLYLRIFESSEIKFLELHKFNIDEEDQTPEYEFINNQIDSKNRRNMSFEKGCPLIKILLRSPDSGVKESWTCKKDFVFNVEGVCNKALILCWYVRSSEDNFQVEEGSKYEYFRGVQNIWVLMQYSCKKGNYSMLQKESVMVSKGGRPFQVPEFSEDEFGLASKTTAQLLEGEGLFNVRIGQRLVVIDVKTGAVRSDYTYPPSSEEEKETEYFGGLDPSSGLHFSFRTDTKQIIMRRVESSLQYNPAGQILEERMLEDNKEEAEHEGADILVEVVDSESESESEEEGEAEEFDIQLFEQKIKNTSKNGLPQQENSLKSESIIDNIISQKITQQSQIVKNTAKSSLSLSSKNKSLNKLEIYVFQLIKRLTSGLIDKTLIFDTDQKLFESLNNDLKCKKIDELDILLGRIYQQGSLDISKEVFQILLHFLKKIEKSEKNNLTIIDKFIIFNLWQHLRILSLIQGPHCSMFILDEKFIKKIEKKVEKIKASFQEKKVNSESSILYGKTIPSKILETIQNLRRIVIPENLISHEIKKMLSNDTLIKPKDNEKFMRMCNPTNFENYISKGTKIDNHPLRVKEALQFNISQSTFIINLEVKILKKFAIGIGSVFNTQEIIYTDFKQSNLQKNLKMFFPHFMGQHINTQNKDQVVALMQRSLQSTIEVVQVLQESFASLPVLTTDQESILKKRLIDFDKYLFRRTYLGVVISTCFAMEAYTEDYHTNNFGEFPGTLKKLSELLVQTVNCIGKHAHFSGIEPTKTTIRKILPLLTEFKRSDSPFDIPSDKSFSFRLEDESKKLGRFWSVSLFRLHPGSLAKVAGIKYRGIEFIKEWTPENSEDIVRNVPGGTFLAQSHNHCGEIDKNNNLKMVIESKQEQWRSTLDIVNLAKLSLVYIGRAITSKSARKVKGGSGSSVNKQSDSKKETNTNTSSEGEVFDVEFRHKVDNVLAGLLFENGIIIKRGNKHGEVGEVEKEDMLEKGEEDSSSDDLGPRIVKKIEELGQSLSSDLDKLSQTLYQLVATEILTISPEIQQGLERITPQMVTSIRPQNMFASYGGQLAEYCTKSVFLTYLYHYQVLQSELSLLSKNDSSKDEQFVKDHSSLWLQATEFRKLSKQFSSSELTLFYQRLVILLLLKPSETWLIADRLPMNTNNTPKALKKQESSLSLSTELALTNQSSSQGVQDYISQLSSLQKGTPLESQSQMGTGSLISSPSGPSSMLEQADAFLKLDGISASKIWAYMKYKGRQFEKSNSKLGNLNRILKNSEQSILSREISNCFELFFRPKNFNRLTHLTEDYSGLARDQTFQQLQKISEVLKKFVEVVCSEYNSTQVKKDALNSLKWLFRGREHPCVMAIDVDRIWKSSKVQKLDQDDEYLHSLLELVEVLMNFCVRKIKEIEALKQSEFAVGVSSSSHYPKNNNNNSLDTDVLQLRKSNSTIDESSMTNIFTKNFGILFQELLEGVGQLKSFEGLCPSKYQALVSLRGRFISRRGVRSTISQEIAFFTGDYREDVKQPESYCYEYNFDENSKQAMLDKDMTQDFSTFQDRLANFKNQRISQLRLILSMIYNSILTVPDITGCFFEKQKKVEPFLEILLGNYALDLQRICLNFLSELANLIPFQVYSRFGGDLERLKELLFKKPRGLERDRRPLYRTFVVNLLKSESHEDEILGLMSELLESDRTPFQVLRVLDCGAQSSFGGFEVGMIVTRPSDPLQEKMIVLPREPCFYKETVNNFHVYDSPEVKKSTNTYSGFENKGMVYDKWPLFNSRTRKVVLVDQSEMVVAPLVLGQDLVLKVLEKLGVWDGKVSKNKMEKRELLLIARIAQREGIEQLYPLLESQFKNIYSKQVEERNVEVGNVSSGTAITRDCRGGNSFGIDDILLDSEKDNEGNQEYKVQLVMENKKKSKFEILKQKFLKKNSQQQDSIEYRGSDTLLNLYSLSQRPVLSNVLPQNNQINLQDGHYVDYLIQNRTSLHLKILGIQSSLSTNIIEDVSFLMQFSSRMENHSPLKRQISESIEVYLQKNKVQKKSENLITELISSIKNLIEPAKTDLQTAYSCSIFLSKVIKKNTKSQKIAEKIIKSLLDLIICLSNPKNHSLYSIDQQSLFITLSKIFRDLFMGLYRTRISSSDPEGQTVANLFEKVSPSELGLLFNKVTIPDMRSFISFYDVNYETFNSIYFSICYALYVLQNPSSETITSKFGNISSPLITKFKMLKFNHSCLTSSKHEDIKQIVRMGALLDNLRSEDNSSKIPTGLTRSYPVSLFEEKGVKIDGLASFKHWSVYGGDNLGIFTLSLDEEGLKPWSGFKYSLNNQTGSKLRRKENELPSLEHITTSTNNASSSNDNSSSSSPTLYLHWRRETDFFFGNNNGTIVPAIYNAITSRKSPCTGKAFDMSRSLEMVIDGVYLMFCDKNQTFIALDEGFDLYENIFGYKEKTQQITVTCNYDVNYPQNNYRGIINTLTSHNTFELIDVSIFGSKVKNIILKNGCQEECVVLFENGQIIALNWYKDVLDDDVSYMWKTMNKNLKVQKGLHNTRIKTFLPKNKILDLVFSSQSIAIAEYLEVKERVRINIQTSKGKNKNSFLIPKIDEKIKKMLFLTTIDPEVEILLILTESGTLYTFGDISKCKLIHNNFEPKNPSNNPINTLTKIILKSQPLNTIDSKKSKFLDLSLITEPTPSILLLIEDFNSQKITKENKKEVKDNSTSSSSLKLRLFSELIKPKSELETFQRQLLYLQPTHQTKLKTQFKSLSNIYFQNLVPQKYTYYTICSQLDDPRLLFKNAGHLRYPYCITHLPSIKRHIAYNIEKGVINGEQENGEVNLRKKKIEIITHHKVSQVHNFFKKISKKMVKGRQKELKKQAKLKAWRIDRSTNTNILSIIPRYGEIQKQIGKEYHPSVLAYMMVKMAKQLIPKARDLKKKADPEKLKRKIKPSTTNTSTSKPEDPTATTITTTDATSNTPIKEDKPILDETHYPSELAIILNQPDLSIPSLLEDITDIFNAWELVISEEDIKFIDGYKTPPPNQPQALIVESFKKIIEDIGEDVESSISQIEEKLKQHFDSETYVSPLKQYFSKTCTKINKETQASETITQRNGIAIIIDGKIPIPIPLVLMAIMSKTINLHKQTVIQLTPDLFRLDAEEWAMIDPYIDPLLTVMVPHSQKKDPEGDEVPSNMEKVEIPILDKMTLEAQRYRQVITDLLRNPRKKGHLTLPTDLVFQSADRLGELEKLSSDYDISILKYLAGGIFWMTHKIYYLGCCLPTVEGNFWDLDYYRSLSRNHIRCLDYYRHRHYMDETPQYEVDRYKGEKSTYQAQGDSFLHQVFYKSMEYDTTGMRRSRFRMMTYIRFRFNNESGIDAGGPTREYLYFTAEEVTQKLKLFVPSENQVNNTGTERNKLVPNLEAISNLDMDNYYKFGYLLAAVYQSGEIINVDLPSMLLKHVIGQEVCWKDYAGINVNLHNFIESLAEMEKDCFEASVDGFHFVLTLSDGSMLELVPGGRFLELDWTNRERYVALVKERVLGLVMPAFDQIKKGFFGILNPANVKWVHWEDLSEDLCGLDYVDLEQLKRITVYSSFDKHHEEAKRFWRVLDTFTQKQLSSYLKYVWGRTRLMPGATNIHKINFLKRFVGIPEAHTCFFSVDIGTYESDEQLKKLLLIGMENCNEIAEDDGQYTFNADFGMQWRMVLLQGNG